MEEKESGARDLLYIHGLQPWVLHCAWVLTYLAVFTIVSGAVTGVCIASFLQRTQPSVLLVSHPSAHGLCYETKEIELRLKGVTLQLCLTQLKREGLLVFAPFRTVTVL